MTHTRAMSESEGVLGPERKAERSCPSCKGGPVVVRVWESHDGAYEDERFDCIACEHVWWIDGIDS